MQAAAAPSTQHCTEGTPQLYGICPGTRVRLTLNQTRRHLSDDSYSPEDRTTLTGVLVGLDSESVRLRLVASDTTYSAGSVYSVELYAGASACGRSSNARTVCSITGALGGAVIGAWLGGRLVQPTQDGSSHARGRAIGLVSGAALGGILVPLIGSDRWTPLHGWPKR